MKKPQRPRKPHKPVTPEAPSKTFMSPEEVCIDEKTWEVEDYIRELKSKGVTRIEIFYGSVEYIKDVEHENMFYDRDMKSYQASVKRYEENMKNYHLKMVDHEAALEAYGKEMADYEQYCREQEAVDDEQKLQELAAKLGKTVVEDS